jgi:hypothetical protein
VLWGCPPRSCVGEVYEPLLCSITFSKRRDILEVSIEAGSSEEM